MYDKGELQSVIISRSYSVLMQKSMSNSKVGNLR